MLYSTFKLSYESIVFLAPAWAMIWVFRPLEPGDLMGRPLLGSESDSGTPHGFQDPCLAPTPNLRQWRYRRPISARVLQGPALGRRGYSRRVHRARARTQPRRIASLPQFPSHASPRLAPIPEESTSRSGSGSEVGSPPSSVYTVPLDYTVRMHSDRRDRPSSIN